MNIEQLRSKLGHPGVPDNPNYYMHQNIDQNPDRVAIKFPEIIDGEVSYHSLTFFEFKDEALKFTQGLTLEGFKKGDRLILLFPVSIDLYLLIFACFYIGVIPVFIDASMGRKKLIQSIKDSKAQGIISLDILLKYKIFIPNLWNKKCFSIDRNRPFVKKLNYLKRLSGFSQDQIKQNNNSPALITFTSGTTGRPKGANRTIEILTNQKIVSEDLWPHEQNEIDMPAFPMLVLQNLGCGVSSVLPSIDFQNYLRMKPDIIVQQMICQKVTRFSAQPFFIEKVCDYLINENKNISSISSLVVGGAVVSKELCRKVIKAFPGVDANIVYGSTEVEPISFTKMSDFLGKKGRGLLVGKVIDILNIRIIGLDDQQNINTPLKREDVGEITLSGPHVIQEYIDQHPANQELKLVDHSGDIWHRTGDLGYLDEEANLWLVGRIKDQVESSYGFIPCYDLEEEINSFDGISKCAFVDSSKILFIETRMNIQIDEISIRKYLKMKNMDSFRIRVLSQLPVDKRHFSRIDRMALSKLTF